MENNVGEKVELIVLSGKIRSKNDHNGKTYIKLYFSCFYWNIVRNFSKPSKNALELFSKERFAVPSIRLIVYLLRACAVAPACLFENNEERLV